MKVLNFGSLNIDYVYQMAHFIRPGETAPCKTLTAGCGGKGLNQSIALAKAGTEVYHAGLYGGEAQFLLDKMQTAGVDTSLLRLGEGANGHAIIQVDENGQNCIILYGGTNRQITEAMSTRSLPTSKRAMCSFCRTKLTACPISCKKRTRRAFASPSTPRPTGRRF
ncbi:MAG: PfkB family carbohydrate kinase [Oscillospiraceae bacterium]